MFIYPFQARLRELQQTTEEEETNAIQWGDKMVGVHVHVHACKLTEILHLSR